MLREYAIIGLGIALLVTLGLLHIARADLGVVQAQHDGFKQTVEAQGKQAQAEAKLKESNNAIQISTAVANRNDALARLRVAQAAASAAASRVPITPAAAKGSDRQCFEPKALSAAVERYRGRVLGLVAEGDRAAIDAKTLMDSWPK